MKRFILIAIVLLASGCTNINKNLTSKDDIDKNFNTLQATITDSNYEMYNNYRTGYKYYTPKGLYVRGGSEYNEIMKAKRNAEYIAMLDKSIAEAEAGGFITKTIDELGAYE